MQKLRRTIREHLHFIIVVTLLTLVMTFPTIVYVFRTDVFWLPTGHGRDVYIKFWDIWYVKQILTGQADPFFTELVNYPTGVSLAFHPLFYLHSIMVNVLQGIMPLSNAYSLTFLLIILSSALAAYVYVNWLLKDKWIALFGAVIFGVNPHTIAIPTWPEVSWIATIPVIMYCFHRGVEERRASLIVFAGILSGFTTTVTPYLYVCVLIMLGLTVCAFAIRKWRDHVYWLHVALLIVAVALSSAWRVIPMLESPEELDEATSLGEQGELHLDLIAFFVNKGSPAFRSISKAVLQTPEIAGTTWHTYIGYLPIGLIGLGLFSVVTRRRMLPWLTLCFVFLILSLGSSLYVLGVQFENILLPKHYLNQVLPFVFQAFNKPSLFMSGAHLPLAVLSCFGLLALREKFAFAARPGFILVLVVVVALEFYVPVQGNFFDVERFAFTGWLAEEEDDTIRLINLPMGRISSKYYLFFQSVSGYPQTQGAIRRLPDSASDYIRANLVLNTWYDHRPTNCAIQNRDDYHAALTQLVEDGFSHVVHHHHAGFYHWEDIQESFRYVEPAYSDDYVSIYRLSDLLDSCHN